MLYFCTMIKFSSYDQLSHYSAFGQLNISFCTISCDIIILRLLSWPLHRLHLSRQAIYYWYFMCVQDVMSFLSCTCTIASSIYMRVCEHSWTTHTHPHILHTNIHMHLFHIFMGFMFSLRCFWLILTFDVIQSFSNCTFLFMRIIFLLYGPIRSFSICPPDDPTTLQ